jgi:hypothetical protein
MSVISCLGLRMHSIRQVKMGTKQGSMKKVEIEELGRTTCLLFSVVALVSSSRLIHLPRRLYLLRKVSDFWEVAPWVASEVAFRRYPPSFPANRKLNVNMGSGGKRKKRVLIIHHAYLRGTAALPLPSRCGTLRSRRQCKFLILTTLGTTASSFGRSGWRTV